MMYFSAAAQTTLPNDIVCRSESGRKLIAAGLLFLQKKHSPDWLFKWVNNSRMHRRFGKRSYWPDDLVRFGSLPHEVLVELVE